MADRYWVGGSAAWDATAGTKWALTSGGAGGQAVPTSSDDVYFDQNSGAVSVSVNSNSVCNNLSFTSVAGNFTGTFGGASAYTLTIFGSLAAVSTMTWTSNSQIIFAATSAQTITMAGKSHLYTMAFNGIGGIWQLQDNLTCSSSNSVVTLTNGTIDLNGKTINCALFNSNNNNVRCLSFGTGKLSVFGNNSRIVDIRNITGLLVTGTPVIDCTYSGAIGTRTIEFGTVSEVNAISLNVTAGTDIVTNAVSSNYKNLNFTGFAGTWNSAAAQTAYGDLIVSAGLTVGASTASLTFGGTSGTQFITTNGKTLDRPLAFNGVGGTFAFQDALTQGSTRAFTVTNGTVQLKNGVTSTVGSFITSGTNQKFLQSTLAGSQATLSQASDTINANNLNIRDINAAGGATWNAYVDQGNTDAGNNLGWAFGASPQASYEITYRLRSFSTPRRF